MDELDIIRPMAIEVEAWHAAQLRRLQESYAALRAALDAGKEYAQVEIQSPLGVMIDLSSDLAVKRQAFTSDAMQAVGIRVPTEFDSTVPAHAMAMAVRWDLFDTEQRIEQLRNQLKNGAAVTGGFAKTVYDPKDLPSPEKIGEGIGNFLGGIVGNFFQKTLPHVPIYTIIGVGAVATIVISIGIAWVTAKTKPGGK